MGAPRVVQFLARSDVGVRAHRYVCLVMQLYERDLPAAVGTGRFVQQQQQQQGLMRNVLAGVLIPRQSSWTATSGPATSLLLLTVLGCRLMHMFSRGLHTTSSTST